MHEEEQVKKSNSSFQLTEGTGSFAKIKRIQSNGETLYFSTATESPQNQLEKLYWHYPKGGDKHLTGSEDCYAVRTDTTNVVFPRRSALDAEQHQAV